jgi:hypothetical protein
MEGEALYVYDYVLYCEGSLKMVVIFLTVMMASHIVKKVSNFPVPSQDATKLYLAGNNIIISCEGVWLVTSLLETGKSLNFFYSVCKNSVL